MPVTLAELGGWPGVLGRLCRREDLSADEAAAVLGTILAGEALPTQVAAFAAAMRVKGETAEEMIGLVRAMREHGEHVAAGPGLLDTCGTGGDRSGTVNASTMAAIVATAAGARVCKHGGRAASSMTGAADVLEALGVAVDLGPDGVAKCISEVGMGFCLAPRFHPAMRHAAPVRRELGVPTVFNFLGPLANPAGATRQLVGVSDPAMAPRMIAVLEANGAERAMVVFGHDGLDELSTGALSSVTETRRKPDGSYERRDYVVDPTAFGFRLSSRDELQGGSPEHNAARVRAILGGEPGPQRDFLLLNAGAALVVSGAVPELSEGIGLAGATIDSGKALSSLEELIRVSRDCAEAGMS